MPGDIITTGTPPGVGSGKKPTPVFLRAGDVMTLGVDKLGEARQNGRGLARVAWRAPRPPKRLVAILRPIRYHAPPCPRGAGRSTTASLEIPRVLSRVGAVVQLVRIPACHAGGRGFESRPLRQLILLKSISYSRWGPSSG